MLPSRNIAFTLIYQSPSQKPVSPWLSMYDSEFITDSILDILVPQDSEYDVAKIISSTNVHENGQSDSFRLFPFIPQRSILYFGKLNLDATHEPLILLINRHLVDELISIYVVLRTPYSEERELQSFVSRLAIVVEAHAIGSSRTSDTQNGPQEQPLSQNRDMIWSAAVDTAEEPLIIIQQNDVPSAKPDMLVTWKLTALLSERRPGKHPVVYT